VGLPARADVTFTKVWPEKIRYVNGETANFTIQVKNTGAEAWQGHVIGEIESGVAERTPLFDHEMTLAAGEEKRLDEKYKVNLGEFGHAIHVVADNGGARVEAREVFCVGPWYYNMGRYLTAFELGRYKTPEEVQAAMEGRWRAWYVTCHELFSTMPGIWAQMTPTTESWFAGQNGYYETMTGTRSFIEAAHRNGMAVMVYDITGLYSAAGEDYSRAHPEWVAYNNRGRPGGFFNMADMDYYRTETLDNYKHNTPGSLAPNVADPQVQDAELADIIRCSRLLGFDGIRWDGQLIGEGYTADGKRIDTDLDAQNAAWNAKMRKTLMDAIPGYTVNYNYGPQSQQEGVPMPKTYKTLGPHAYLLWESIRGLFSDPNSPLNKWEGFIEGVRAEINGYARPNSNFQHFGWYGTTSVIHQNHTQAIYYALGGHWDTWTPLRYDAFSMRYGEYLWDTRLTNLPDGSTRVQVADANDRLWWKQFVQERPREGGGHLIVTHLLNKPVHERQDEFEKEAPPPQTDIKVTLTPPGGEQVAHAYVLTPDADRNHWCAEVKPVVEGGKASVVVPGVEYWSFVVWETGA
jgi:hypothetical protein